jgi:hypothetical protein
MTRRRGRALPWLLAAIAVCLTGAALVLALAGRAN